MNPTGCVTALGDGGEAFVVLLPDDDHCRRRHLEHPSLPPLPPSSLPPLTNVDPYKSRPRRKDRGAFVVLPEPPPAASSSAQTSSQPTGCSGRVSPFRGHGFKTPENGRSRASSPSSEPLRRQSSEPRIATGRRRSPATKQRLSVSTKDLSKTATAGKPPLVPSTKSSPRKKPGQSGPPTPRKLQPKSPLPLRSPKTPRRSQPPAAVGPAVAAKPTVAAKPAVAAKPTVAAKPMTGANRTGATRPAAAASRPQPAVRSSPRMSKKHSVATVPSNKADNAPSPKTTTNTHGDVQVTVTAAATTTAVATTAPSLPSYTSSRTVGPATALVTGNTATANTATSARTPTSTVPVMPITASTSATAIATTHATNAIASAVVDGGPIVTAVPPPAAIAANTLATLSVAGPAAIAAKPPPSATRPREPPATAAAAPKQNASTVVVVDRGFSTEPVTTQRSGDKMTTTTPPLSYELQEIVVEPEMENQSGRTAARLSIAGSGADGNKTSSTTTTSSSNGHKTVAWARQSEKIIVPADVPSRAAETAASSTTKDPAYKRFARKLCGGGAGCGGGRRRPTKASSVAAADSRSSKCWTAVWKRRPRWCGGPRCCGRKRKDAGRPTAAVAAAGAAEAGDRRPQWWRRCKPCWCCGKRKKRLGASSDSVGVLGISPPSADTFCGKFKRRLCCCCGCCVVPKFFRRLCCCCPCCGGSGKRPDVPKSKSADTQRPSLFKCTGCCTNIPKLDAVFVDHSSVMKGAIPVLPVTLAWLCLVFNVIIPGAGTFSSGMLCLCVGKPRFTVNDNFQSRVGAFCVNFIVAAAQLFTVLFCLVGWGWSIWWGVIMLKMAKKYQKVKVIDHHIEAPIAVDHNHQI